MVYRNWILLQMLAQQKIAERHLEAREGRLGPMDHWFPIRLVGGRVAARLLGLTSERELIRAAGRLHSDGTELPCRAESPGR